MNALDDEWGEQEEDWSGGGALAKRLTPGGWEHFLGASVYELRPGDFVVYHAHHGSDELVLVLEGSPTLRTPAAEQRLARGDVVHFPPGPDGAHGLRNETDEPVRYVMFGTRVTPEVVEYPDLPEAVARTRPWDLRQVTAQSRHGLFLIHDVQEAEA